MSVSKRHLWILDQLASYDYSFSQLSQKWDRASVNDDYEILTPRTFRNDIIAIQEKFGVRIECDRYGEYRYHVENVGPLLSKLRSLLDCIDKNTHLSHIRRELV